MTIAHGCLRSELLPCLAHTHHDTGVQLQVRTAAAVLQLRRCPGCPSFDGRAHGSCWSKQAVQDQGPRFSLSRACGPQLALPRQHDDGSAGDSSPFSSLLTLVSVTNRDTMFDQLPMVSARAAAVGCLLHRLAGRSRWPVGTGSLQYPGRLS